MYIKITKIVFRFFQIHNDDGVWVRLSNECVRQMCTSSGYPEAWCLQYNQHLGKTLLVPVEDPKSVVEESGFRKVSAKKSHSNESPLKERKLSAPPQIVTGPGLYHVVKCGASGHNIRSRPGLSAPPVGMLVSGNRVVIVADVIISKKYFSVPKSFDIYSQENNQEGTWVQLDSESKKEFCFNTDGEAWSLAVSRGDVVYLQHDSNRGNLHVIKFVSQHSPFDLQTHATRG